MTLVLHIGLQCLMCPNDGKVDVFVLETKFCEFESRLGQQDKWESNLMVKYESSKLTIRVRFPSFLFFKPQTQCVILICFEYICIQYVITSC